MQQRTRVVVLRGGPSEEYEVSLKTGQVVISAINAEKYDVLDVVITKAGEWLLRGMLREPRDILSHVDIVFLALHGGYGEDGTVQRLIDSHGVKYTGSRAFPSAMAFNKAMTKDRMKDKGIKMAQHMIVGKDMLPNLHGTVSAISALFGPRYIVKPIASGSSIGTIFAESPIMLEQALRTALGVYDQVLVEEYIAGKEATCGVVENFRGKNHYALPPIEIAHTGDVFDYQAKYGGGTEEICPGRFSRAEKEEIERLAILAHTELGLSHYSRSDFIIANDGIYFLEVNTLPGLTTESLLPKSLEAVGCSYSDFIEHLLMLAHRHPRGI